MSCPEQVAADPEQILDDAVHRCEPFCRSPITPRLYEDVEDVAVLVDGPPQILQSPLDLDEQSGVALAAPAVP